MRASLSTLLVLGLALPALSRPLLVKGARIFDGVRVLEADSVLVDGGRVVRVGRGLEAPAGAEVVEGRGCTLLPGLVDAHVHTYGDALRLDAAFGVTTVVDMFTDPALVRAARAADRPGEADLRSAGMLATCPGGHGTEYPVRVTPLTGPAGADAWVAARVQEGSAFIKIIVEDGSAFGIPFPSLDAATVGALCRAAHARGLKAVAHATTPAGARLALEAGADGLAHAWAGAEGADDLARLAKARGAFVIPTLSVFATGPAAPGRALAEDPQMAPWLDAAARASLLRGGLPLKGGSQGREAVAALLRAGVPLLAGTDAPNPGTASGVSLHGELELLVAAGLTPLQALQAATRLPAVTFGLEDRGLLAEGRRADLLLVKGDPTTDVRATRAIQAVWKAGVRVDREALARELEAARQASVHAPALAAGPVGATPREGGAWAASTDAMAGGGSTAKVTAGAQGPWRVEGTVDGRLPYAWSGALWTPGGGFDRPRDLSALTTLKFRARGEGAATFRVMVFTEEGGFMPSEVRFKAGEAWTEVAIPLSRFKGRQAVKALLLGAGPAPGSYTLHVDDLRFE